MWMDKQFEKYKTFKVSNLCLLVLKKKIVIAFLFIQKYRNIYEEKNLTSRYKSYSFYRCLFCFNLLVYI